MPLEISESTDSLKVVVENNIDTAENNKVNSNIQEDTKSKPHNKDKNLGSEGCLFTIRRVDTD